MRPSLVHVFFFLDMCDYTLFGAPRNRNTPGIPSRKAVRGFVFSNGDNAPPGRTAAVGIAVML